MKKTLFTLIAFLFFLVPPAFAGPQSTSGATVYDLIERFRSVMNEDAEDFYTNNTDLVYWVDQAVDLIAKQTRCLEAGVSNIIVVTNTWRYSLNQDTWMDVQEIEHDSGNTTDPQQVVSVERIYKSDYGRGKETGRPQKYCIWNDTLEIYPIPRSDQSGTTLYVYGVEYPSGVTNTSSLIETPAALDDAILLYMRAMGYYRKSWNPIGDQFLGFFNDALNAYVVQTQRRRPVK